MRTNHNENNYHSIEINTKKYHRLEMADKSDNAIPLDRDIKNLLAKFLGKKSLLLFITVNKCYYKEFFFTFHQRINQSLIRTGWVIEEEKIPLTPATTQRTLNQLMLYEVANLFFTNPQQTQTILNSMLDYRKKGYHFETTLAREVYAFFKRQRQNQRNPQLDNSAIAILYEEIKIDRTRERFVRRARPYLPKNRANLICSISWGLCFFLLFIALVVFISQGLDTSSSAPLPIVITGLGLLFLGSVIQPLWELEAYCIRRSAQAKAIHCSATISRTYAALNLISLISKKGIQNLKVKMHDTLILKNAALVQKFMEADSYGSRN